ncbi:MAG: glycosyltransferase, partial [Actinomycetes bacterium]
ESSRESLSDYGLRDVSIVPVGLDMPNLPERPPKEPRPTVAFLGRLAANKRPDHALEAFLLARRAMPDARMWVVGSGPMEQGLRRRAESDPVEFHGRVDHATKLDLLARSHALLVTSVREGWGLVVSEAAAVGTPSIGYDVAGLRDSLRASNGVAVPPTVRDLADTVARVLPTWTAGAGPLVAPGGVSPWSEVAAHVLRHLDERRVRGTS